ncbi:MAG: transporter associated domain-containing protein, partial [Flavobacteriia bacterium]
FQFKEGPKYALFFIDDLFKIDFVRHDLVFIDFIIGEQHEEVIENGRGEAETLGGLVIEVAGRILKNNEYITLGPLKLIVESSDKKRVKSVKVIVHEN